MYLLDTNVLVEAHRRYYSMDIIPSYWEWLEQNIAAGKIATIEPVYREIVAGGDRFAEWIKDYKEKIILPDSVEYISAISQLATWAMGHSRYTNNAKEEFLRVADSSLVAHAKAHEYTVVTLEVSAPESKRRILIPDACLYFKVEYCDPFEMMRKLEANI